MDPITLLALGTIISAIATTGTTIYQNNKNIEATKEANALNYEIMKEQNNFNSIEAEKQRNFEKMMSDTSIQRQQNDLKEAGINPLLAGMNGGASVPTGMMAQSTTTGTQKPATIDLSGITNTIQSINNTMMLYAIQQNKSATYKYGADKLYQSKIDTRPTTYVKTNPYGKKSYLDLFYKDYYK